MWFCRVLKRWCPRAGLQVLGQAKLAPCTTFTGRLPAPPWRLLAQRFRRFLFKVYVFRIWVLQLRLRDLRCLGAGVCSDRGRDSEAQATQTDSTSLRPALFRV